MKHDAKGLQIALFFKLANSLSRPRVSVGYYYKTKIYFVPDVLV